MIIYVLVAYLPYIQVILSVLLVGLILLQRSEAGLGAGFGGEGSGGARFVRRGFERTLFFATVFAAILFVFSTITPLIFG